MSSQRFSLTPLFSTSSKNIRLPTWLLKKRQSANPLTKTQKDTSLRKKEKQHGAPQRKNEIFKEHPGNKTDKMKGKSADGTKEQKTIPKSKEKEESDKQKGKSPDGKKEQKTIPKSTENKETVSQDGLPPGFRRESVMRTSGDSAGKYDYYIYK